MQEQSYGSYNSHGHSRGGGGSSGNPNPISTLGFLWNMGYPPPPITMDGLKKLCETCIDNNTFTIPEKAKTTLVAEVKQQPFSRSQCVLFVIQQSLHSSKLEKVSNALELTNTLIDEMRVDFARHINREFMTSVKNVINTTSYKDRTIQGSLKKLEKWVVGSSSSGMATDPKVQTLQRRTLQMLRHWIDVTIDDELDCHAIHELYRKLTTRGYQFPSMETPLPPLSSFMSGISSTNFNSMDYRGISDTRGSFNPPPPRSSPPAHGSTSNFMRKTPSNNGMSNRKETLDDSQVAKLSRALEMYRSPQTNPAAKERCVNVFMKMIPRLMVRIEQELDNRSSESQVARLITLKEEMDQAISAFYFKDEEEDEFADLGLDPVLSNSAVPRMTPNCPFTDTVESRQEDSFNSVLSEECDADLLHPPPSQASEKVSVPPKVVKKVPDPFAALDDVWSEEHA